MKPVKQITTDTCFPACLATLLDLPIGIVPNYAHKHWPHQIACTQRWLRKMDKSLLYVPVCGDWKKRGTFEHMNVPVPCIVGAKIKRSSDGHVMVGTVDKHGIKVTHDPAHYPYLPSEYSIDCLLFLIQAIPKKLS